MDATDQSLTLVISLSETKNLSFQSSNYFFSFAFGVEVQTGWWFSVGTPVSSTNKSDSHDITDILYKIQNAIT